MAGERTKGDVLETKIEWIKNAIMLILNENKNVLSLGALIFMLVGFVLIGLLYIIASDSILPNYPRVVKNKFGKYAIIAGHGDDAEMFGLFGYRDETFLGCDGTNDLVEVSLGHEYQYDTKQEAQKVCDWLKSKNYEIAARKQRYEDEHTYH